MSNELPTLRALSFLISSLMACATQQAQALPTVGSSFNVKVVASSTGAPCTANCWERWKETAGLGFIMVEYDSSGYIVAAGRVTDPYFQDLVASTDEAIHTTIATANQVTRYGTVRTVVSGCVSTCVFTVDFGFRRDTTLGINSSGQLSAVAEIDDAILELANDGSSPPTGHPQCPNNGVNCPGGSHWGGAGFRGSAPVEIWIVYDEYGHAVKIIYVYADGHEEEHDI